MDDATASDNCSDVSITVEASAGDAAGNYTIVRTFTATDACGNSTSASQTITVEDTTAPELSIPADYTAECSDELTLDDATATDNCGEVTIEVSSETTAGDCDGSHCDARSRLRTTLATARLPRRPSRLRTRQHQSSRAFLPTTRLSALTRCLWTTRPADNCSDEHHSLKRHNCCNAAGIHDCSRSLRRTIVATAHKRLRRSPLRTPQLELSIPADYTAECSDELILDDATANNCGEVTIEVSARPPQATAMAATL